MHRDDLRRVAPLWLNYTEDVREDPEVRQNGQHAWGHHGLQPCLLLHSTGWRCFDRIPTDWIEWSDCKRQAREDDPLGTLRQHKNLHGNPQSLLSSMTMYAQFIALTHARMAPGLAIKW